MADNISDQLADTVTTHAVNILRVSAGMRDDVLTMLGDLQKELIKDIEDHGPTPREAALLKQTNATIASAYQEIKDATHDNLNGITGAEVHQAANLVNHAIGIDTMSVTTSPKKLEAIAGKTLIEGHYPAQWWDGQASDLQERFAGQMRMGMLRGESVEDLVQRVRGTKALGYTDGIMAATRAQAEALVRTSVQSVANESRINTYRENPDVIKGIQWLSTLDSRTTPICRALDGLQWDLDLKPIGHSKAFPGPIAHWNCRSTQIPITFSWAELSGKKVTVNNQTITKALQKKAEAAGMPADEAAKLEAKTRASMDGQVASTQTFGDWIADKPIDFQNQVLGTQQAQLYRAGKITMRDLTDQGNRPLTVAQLQKLATEKQLIPPRVYVENQGGLTLHERAIAEDQLATMIARGVEMTTYLNSETGKTVTQKNQLVTKDTAQQITDLDADTVIKTALQEKDILTVFEAKYFEQFGVNEVKVVLLDGTTLDIKGEFTADVVQKISDGAGLKSSRPTLTRIIAMLKDAGLTVTRSRANNVEVSTPAPLK